MSERVRVVRHEGRLLAAKECGPDDGDAVRAEAELLGRCQVPGVVELVGTSGGERPLLLTAWVGPRSLADLPRPVPPERAAALCLAVAATVSRLHRTGVVHGAVEATHVLLDADGRPVLCGFGSGGPIGAPVRRPATDAGPPTTDGLRPAIDVAGLGRLLQDLLGEGDERAAGRHGWRSARRAASVRRALLGVAAQATTEDPGARPSVAAFSRAVRRAAPDAALTARDDVAPSDPIDRPPHRTPETGVRPSGRRRPTASAALTILALATVGATTWFGLRAWAGSPPTRTVTASPAAPRSSTSRPPAPPPPTSSTTSTAAPTTTLTRDGAPAAEAVGDPVVVEHGGRRYAVGEPGDVVAVGPWLCDGRDLAVVLRPGDGTVSLFAAWPEPGGTATAQPVATVPGASALEGVADGAGCAALVVTDATAVLATLTAEDLA